MVFLLKESLPGLLVQSQYEGEPSQNSGNRKDGLMSATRLQIPPAEPLVLQSLINPIEQGIASRILAKTDGGHLTLFALDAGQRLTEHTSPFDAIVVVLEGVLILTIADVPVRATPGTIVRMPADIPHAVDAPESSRMLLIMLKDRPAA